ncbi:MAG: hypothetical protein ACI95R_001179, partial [Halioglobus sp.]
DAFHALAPELAEAALKARRTTMSPTA